MTDKRPKATKVKCKGDESITKQLIFLEYPPLWKKHLSFSGAHCKRSQNVTVIDQEKHKIKQIYIWNPMTNRFIM